MALSSVIRYVRALDTTSVVGAGKTGLEFGDITAKYLVEGGTLTSLTTETITTLGTHQAPTSSAHIRIKELSASDPANGEYEIHFHDTQVAAAGKKLWLFLSASNALFEVVKVDLETDYYLTDLWRRHFKKVVKTSTAIVTYEDDGTTPRTTQAISQVGDVQTLGEAS